jgi:hypothetical protein
LPEAAIFSAQAAPDSRSKRRSAANSLSGRPKDFFTSMFDVGRSMFDVPSDC